MKTATTLLLLTLVLLANQPQCFGEGQSVRRAIFDIGSGSTKMVVADVDLNTGKIEFVYSHQQPVPYKLDLEQSANNRFSEKVCNQGIAVLARMKWLALQQGASQFAAVATSAFRTAGNGMEFMKLITAVLGIPTRVISQKQEAILGFLGAVTGEAVKPQHIIVWDIGGGSMQITTVNAQGQYMVYYGKLASISFARYIIEKIHRQDIKKIATPNPITAADLSKALDYARSFARQVPETIRRKLQHPKTVILGIGGVHYYSIRNQVKTGRTYDRAGLQKTLEQRLGKTDQQIGGKYANTEISNLALVLAYFRELGIKSVRVKKINMAHSLLLYHSFWKTKIKVSQN